MEPKKITFPTREEFILEMRRHKRHLHDKEAETQAFLNEKEGVFKQEKQYLYHDMPELL